MVGERTEAVGASVGGGNSGTKMPTLEEDGTNLTKLVEEGKLDPVVGRQQQIKRVVQILGRRTKNNPCLIGEPSIGKTTIAKGLAQTIASSDVPETIEGNKVITLDMGLLVVGTKYRGEFEERLKKLMEEIKQSDEIILFIDEVDTLIRARAAEGAIDAPNILKPTIARGELQETTRRNEFGFFPHNLQQKPLISLGQAPRTQWRRTQAARSFGFPLPFQELRVRSSKRHAVLLIKDV